MNYYQDIKLYPDNEIDIAFLRNKTYAKLHKAIFDLKAKNIGVSFPQANKKLGCVIRIHSTQEQLQKLQALNWIGGLSGYCSISDILPVPSKLKGHQTISRIRQSMSNSKLKKKIIYQQEKGYLKTNEDIKAYEKQYKLKMFKTGLSNPYFELQSTSTANKYRLYVGLGEVLKNPVVGDFNRFGLSNEATVPIF